MKKRFTSLSSYKFGFTTNDILRTNVEVIADRFFWPNKLRKQSLIDLQKKSLIKFIQIDLVARLIGEALDE